MNNEVCSNCHNGIMFRKKHQLCKKCYCKASNQTRYKNYSADRKRQLINKINRQAKDRKNELDPEGLSKYKLKLSNWNKAYYHNLSNEEKINRIKRIGEKRLRLKMA